MPTKAPHFNQIRTWIKEVEETKTAAVKDPGGYKGPTSHPSKDVDDKTREATEGERSKENTADNKEDRGPASVDSTSPGSGGSQESHQMQIGTTKSETGGQPSVEDDYKSDKEDPGTSHPANAEEVGKKYAALAEQGNLAELLKLHKQASDSLLAKIAVSAQQTQPTTPSAPATPATKTAGTVAPKAVAPKAEPTAPAAEQEVKLAAEAGYEWAAVLGYKTKEAADQSAKQMLAQLIKEANDDADRVGPFLLAYAAERDKMAKEAAKSKKAAAGDEGDSGEDHASPPGEEEALLPGAEEPATGAAGSAGAEDGGSAAGGPPAPGGDAMGGDPAAAGGPPGGGGPGAGLQELAMALLELGIDPAELAQAAAALQGGGAGAGGPPGGAMPPMGGMGGPPPGAGAPPGVGGLADMGAKIAAAVIDFKRSGKFEVRAAKTAAERAYRNEMKNYILEIMGAGNR